MSSLSRRELDDIKPWVEKTVKRVLGFPEPTVVMAAFNCVSKGLDESKTIEMLQPLLEKSAPKFVSLLFETIREVESSRKSSKPRKRTFKEDDSGEEVAKPKKSKIPSHFSDDLDAPLPEPTPSPGQLTSAQIKEMMVQARKQITARKEQIDALSMMRKPAIPTLMPESQSQLLAKEALDKAKRAAEIQARIQAQMASSGLGKHLSKPTPLILDDQGRTIDASGNTIQLTQRMPTLKANIRAKKREEFKAVQDKPDIQLDDTHKFFDQRVTLQPAVRPRRGFKFHEKGKYQMVAQRVRAKAQLEKLQSEIAQAAKKTGISSAARLALIQPKKTFRENEIPDVEWWDSVILKVDSYAGLDGKDKNEYIVGVTHLVEHPIQLKPPSDKDKAVEVPIFLTKKERKKMRRQSRREADLEKQEKVRLGLEPPPEPKVRMANLMRVLGNDAVQDPTKVEAHVRAQMAKRQRLHEEANAARKLTDEQKREKKLNKIREDTAEAVNVAVYRVRDLSGPSHKFKVEANCKQLLMTGLVILFKEANVVVVEGGPKQQKKFKRLMMHRIKWDQDKRRKHVQEDDSDEEDHAKVNRCVLVWEGTTPERNFGDIKFKQCPTESMAREVFKKHSVEHYWDLAHNEALIETSQDL
ncbi:U4/U6 small nuclear ribonucleoprotein Prp3-like [Antedon mediterranea]|uniref:U4/U6 small nuclear ribonucleoprotein Prp3-like n=1 Tax=Antedon mediterranea TaxID=105859 RepID=UPI003AF72CD8